MSSSSALQPSSSPNAKVSAAAAGVATVALASHPFRPLYLSGESPHMLYGRVYHAFCLVKSNIYHRRFPLQLVMKQMVRERL